MSIISRLVALALILSCAGPALADGINNPGGSSGGATTIVSGTTPITGGTDKQVLFNDGGVVNGDPALTFTKATGNLASTTYNKVTITAPATGSTLTIANGKTLTVSNTLTFTATDGSTLAIGTGGTLGTAAYQNTGTSGANLPFLNGANTWSGLDTFTSGLTMSGSSLTFSGNQSVPAWTTSGVREVGVAGTLTDTTSSGTVAAAYTNTFGGNTIAASNATTFTNYYNAYFKPEVAGTNVTLTNTWALGADSAKINGALTVTGTANFTSTFQIGGNAMTFPGTAQTLAGLGTAQTWTANQSMASANQRDWNADTVLSRFGAGLLGLSNTTNPTKLQVYSTTDSITAPTNYSRVIVDAGTTAATFKFGSEHGGSGTALTKFAVLIDGTSQLDYAVTTAGVWTAVTIAATTARLGNINNTDNSVTAWTFQSGSAHSTFSVASVNPLMRFAGTTSSFPAIKRSTTTLIARLADDSADTTFQSGQLIVSGIGSDATHTDSTVCQDTTSHQFYAGSGAAGICLGTSSVRFKTDLAPLAAGLDQILRVDTVSYRYRPGYGDPARKLYGFTAEQMAQVMPELVGFDADGLPNSVDWAGMVPVLVRAIQQQQARIETLEGKIR